MREMYTKERIIQYSDLDMSGRLGFFKLPLILQDLLTEYFGSFGSSNDILKANDHAGWVLTKTRIHAERLPFWQTKLRLNVYCTKIDAIRVVVEVKAEDPFGRTAFISMMENCAMDLESRKLRRIDTVSFPKDMTVCPSLMTSKYERLRTDFTEADRAFEAKVHWSDIDFSDHANNASYVNYLLRVPDTDFLCGKRVTDMELHYISESRRGDLLEIYRQAQEGFLEFLIKKENVEVLRAKIAYTDK